MTEWSFLAKERNNLFVNVFFVIINYKIQVGCFCWNIWYWSLLWMASVGNTWWLKKLINYSHYSHSPRPFNDCYWLSLKKQQCFKFSSNLSTHNQHTDTDKYIFGNFMLHLSRGPTDPCRQAYLSHHQIVVWICYLTNFTRIVPNT